MNDLERVVKRYIDRNARVFYSKNVRAKLAGASVAARHATIAWRLSDPNSLKVALGLGEAIALASAVQQVMVYRDHAYVIYQFQLHGKFWKSYTRANVTGLGIGLGDRRRQVDITFPEFAPQIGVYGEPGSGKTELIKSAICALGSSNPPDRLKFVISDWHRQLSDFRNLAHLAAPIAYNDDQATDALISLVQAERARRFGGDSDSDYRLIFVIDEASEIVTTDQRIHALADIANSRKWQINLILGTQKPSAKALPDIIDKIGNRHVGKVLDARTSANIAGQSGLECHKLSGCGDFLHVVGANHERYQVAKATEADIAALPRVVEVPKPEVEFAPISFAESSPGPGRPENRVEPDLVADYLANYEMSVRQFIREREISQRKYYLHKEFAEELKGELARYGLGICRLEDKEQI